MNNAGTASRFLTTLCNLIEGLSVSNKDSSHLFAESGEVRLSGNKRMHERPIGDLVTCLNDSGAAIRYSGKAGSLPLTIQTSEGLLGGVMRLSGTEPPAVRALKTFQRT